MQFYKEKISEQIHILQLIIVWGRWFLEIQTRIKFFPQLFLFYKNLGSHIKDVLLSLIKLTYTVFSKGN